jgi:hypothetical protein
MLLNKEFKRDKVQSLLLVGESLSIQSIKLSDRSTFSKILGPFKIVSNVF